MYEPDNNDVCGVCSRQLDDSVVRADVLECNHSVCAACLSQESETLHCARCLLSSAEQGESSTLERVPTADTDVSELDAHEVPSSVTLASKMRFTSLKDMYLKLRGGMERGRLFYAAVLGEEGRKFGKICIVGDMIFIYSFTLSEIDEGATIYWFSDLKNLFQESNVKVFLKVPSNVPEKKVTLLIKVAQTPVLTAVFTRKCTGEEGQGLKGAAYGFKSRRQIQDLVRFRKASGREKIYVAYSAHLAFKFLITRKEEDAPPEGQQKPKSKRRSFGIVTNFVSSHEILRSSFPFNIRGETQCVIDSGIALIT